MKRKSRIIVVIATIVLTFGTLMATVGHKHFDHRFNADGRTEHCESTQKKEGSYGKSTNKDNISKHSRTPEIKTDSITHK
jgi:hypothetical protein